MGFLIMMKRPKGEWKTEANAGMDEVYARKLLEDFRAYNPGYDVALVEQKELFALKNGGKK